MIHELSTCKSGRVLAVGDVHGCSGALKAVLALVQPKPEDMLVFLGDYVDRGPDSQGVVETVLQLRASHQVVALTGNHELMMLQARFDRSWAKDWLKVGGRETLISYGVTSLNEIPEAHWEFMKSVCLPYFETETHIFVHAGVDPDWPMDQQSDKQLFWSLFNPDVEHYSGKIVVCGHTTQNNGLPAHGYGAICIDTWAYGAGWLTCLDVNSGQYWQARESGEGRTGSL